MNSTTLTPSPLAAGQLVMVDIVGKTLTDETADFLRLHRIRAVCLFRSNIGTEAEFQLLTSQLRDVMGPKALIGIDQEGGSVIRATFLPQAPAAMALGAGADEKQAEAVGAAVARGLRHLGINWNFAPVVDINNNPANPVIGARSFSSDPHAVTRLAGAWMRGSLREGVACCIKHFPGHGDTDVDSHHALPVVNKSIAELEALELVPFRALTSHAPAMMTAHIVYTALDASHPATLSPRVIDDVLRKQWAYDGVVITDSLVMKAIQDRYGHTRAAPMALAAGADMVMALGSREDQANAISAIALAIADTHLDIEALYRSRQRLDSLGARFPAFRKIYSQQDREADEQLMRRVWARGLTLIGHAIRPPAGRMVRVITQRHVPTDGVSEAGLSGNEVAALFDAFEKIELIQVDSLDEFDWATLPDDHAFTVLASNLRKRYRAASRNWTPDLHISLWNPFQVLDIPAPAIVAWGFSSGALLAIRQWLAGEIKATGTCPIDLIALK